MATDPDADGEPVSITALDHVVLYSEDVEALSQFYADLFEAERFEYGPGWWSVRFDGGQVNFRPVDDDLELVVATPTPGAIDMCLVTGDSLDSVIETLGDLDIELVKGPVEREGSRGPMSSVYFTDPEGNLVEIAEYP